MSHLSQSSDNFNNPKRFIITMHSKYRPVREKPILGIDYDKLKYGKKKSHQNFTMSTVHDSSQNNEIPRDSIIRNQTQESFRPSTNHSSSSKMIFRSPTNEGSKQFENPLKADFETFKKYQKEFMEFRKQKNINTQSHYINSQYPRVQKQNFTQQPPQSPNVFQRLSWHKNNKQNGFQSMHDNTYSKFDHKRSSLSVIPGDNQQQNLDKINDQKVQNTENFSYHDSQKVGQVQFEDQISENPNQEQSNKKSEIVIQDQLQQLENADRNFELQKQQQQNQQGLDQQTDSNASDNNYTSSQQFFDPYSTQYMKMVEKHFEKNPDYYRHLQGDCICGRCICGKCKCPYRNVPVDFRRGMQSLYQADFQKHKNLEQLPQITMDFHSQVQCLEPIKCCSTTQNDFRPHDVKEPVYEKGPKYQHTDQPFIGSTNYRNNFVNWKAQQPEKIPNPSEHTVVQSIPFTAKTMYMENFQQKPMKDRDFEEYIRQKSKTKLSSPMNPDFRYMNQTNYQFFYQAKNPERTNILKPFQHSVKTTPSVPDQYRTTFVREFEDKSSVVCPSRLELIKLNKKKQLEKYQEYLEKERLKNSGQQVTMHTILSQANSKSNKTHHA
ncbi:hypothetical protein ABPG74_004200 [Tetrahymena malaccensis]